MKLKIIFLSLLIVCISTEAAAADAGLRYIQARGFVRCGTDLSTKTYAFKNSDKQWQGVDADFCKALSMATLGSDEKFELVNVPSNEISKALATNKIDIMLGNNALSASQEIKSRATGVDILYYDRQMFLAHPLEADSMESYRGSKVCAVNHSEDLASVNEYSRRYNLGLKVLSFPSLSQAKEAFLLKRCQLLSANEIYLRGVEKSVVTTEKNLEILPEVISYRPVYAYVDRNNPTLRIICKWILNAFNLAESYGITSKNIDVFIGVTDNSIRNLLGIDPKLWSAFGLQPEWAKRALKELGNFGEIYERNLGKDSEIGIPREKNHLIENGGLIKSQPFL